MSTKKFGKSLESLEHIVAFVNEFLCNQDSSEELKNSLNLAVEEIFVNMVRYNLTSRNDISIRLERDNTQILISLTDYDVEPFDLTKTDPVNVNAPLEDRRNGGLGIHLTRSLMDDVKYEYHNRNSTVTLIKNLKRK